MKKIVFAGGTGNLGTMLIKFFRERNYDLIVLSRQRMVNQDPKIKFVLWDAENLDDWQESLSGADVLINLCGLSINRRFTKTNKDLLRSSRLTPTRLLGEAINKLQNPVKLWINFSGVSLFNGASELCDETSHSYSNDFLGKLTQDWEKAFVDIKVPNTKKVILRMSPILSRKSGMFAELYPLVKLGLGGKVGNGKQLISWIHEIDFVRLVDWIIESPENPSIFHACSPNPVSNKEFMYEFRKAAGVDIGLPLPVILAKIGSLVKNVDSSLLLESVPVTTLLTLKNGFQFNFPYIQPAINQLIKSST